MATATGSVRKRYRHARVDAIVGLAAVSSLVFLWLVAVPAFGPERWARHLDHPELLTAHIVGGAIMLLSGAVALRIGLTKSWFRWHKAAGYTYLASGALSSIVALIRSFDTAHTPGWRLEASPFSGCCSLRWPIARSAIASSSSTVNG